MKQFMVGLILCSIALIVWFFALIKELKNYLRKKNKFENNVNVEEGIIKKIEKTKLYRRYTWGICKYTVYVELPDNKIIKTTINPQESPIRRGQFNGYINRKET